MSSLELGRKRQEQEWCSLELGRKRQEPEQRCRGGNWVSRQKSSLSEVKAPEKGVLNNKRHPSPPCQPAVPPQPSPAALEAKHASIPSSVTSSEHLLSLLSPTHRSTENKGELLRPFTASFSFHSSGTPDSYLSSGCTSSFHIKKQNNKKNITHTYTHTPLHLHKTLQWLLTACRRKLQILTLGWPPPDP